METNQSNESGQTLPVKRPHYLLQAWLVIFLSALYAAILVYVQIQLGPQIEDNKTAATFAQIPVLVQGADPNKTEKVTITGTDGKAAVVYRVKNEQGEAIGWVFPGTGQGFSDTISLIIGLDSKIETLTGLYVLDQKETPGLGNFITGENFRGQFAGKNVYVPLAAKAGETTSPEEIRAVTGATISSKAVCDIVNATVAKYKNAALTQN
ncbi:MAG: FMN-binding protein [Thermoguttaceae bacterium]|nr:FMN-binding protein [Thermoguttaceae bacterium]MDO4857765.1 FMN-binding protein [Thermoguttaceae bacterium]